MRNFAHAIRSMPITRSMILVAAVPVAFTVCMSFFLTYPKLRQMSEYNRILDIAELTTFLSDLVHEQQKERGATAIFLSTAGASFSEELAAQRKNTDAKRALAEHSMAKYLSRADESETSIRAIEKLRDITQKLGDMTAIREQVDALSIAPPQAISYYTGLNNAMLSVVTLASLASNDTNTAMEIKAFSSFLNGKERAGIERAIGSSGFGIGRFTVDRLLKLQELISIQNAFFNMFLQEASIKVATAYEELTSSDAFGDVERMRDVAFESTAFQNLQGITGNDFFGAMTKKINLLKGFEDQLAEDILLALDTRRSATRNQAIVSIAASLVAVILGAFAVWMVSHPVREYMSEVSRAASRMAEGDLAILMPQATSSELGEIVVALDHFRTATINASEQESQRHEREKEEQRLLQEERRRQQEDQKEKALQREAELEAARKREIAIAEEISEVVAACAQGDFGKRLSLQDKDGVFEKICSGINEISESTGQALHDISDALSALSHGDLNHTVATTHRGVFGEIGLTVNEMLEKLNTIVTSIRSNTDVVYSYAGNLSNSSESLSQRTVRNSAALEETSAALSQIEKSVSGALDNARKARSSAASVVQESQSGIETVDQAVAAMQEIKESSDSISKIIDLINGIAFQTNLLALNAGIEAARAGDSGRGFAVVASEVRALAARSLEAASEISSVISDTGEKVDEGVRLVNLSGDALRVITNSILTVAQNIDSVAESADDQAAGIKHIAASTDELDRSTQDNASMFEDNTQVIAKMKDATLTLLNEVDFFKTGAKHASGASKQKMAMRA